LEKKTAIRPFGLGMNDVLRTSHDCGFVLITWRFSYEWLFWTFCYL